LLCKNLV